MSSVCEEHSSEEPLSGDAAPVGGAVGDGVNFDNFSGCVPSETRRLAPSRGRSKCARGQCQFLQPRCCRIRDARWLRAGRFWHPNC